MNIELSEKEYRDLLDILHIADVVLSGHRREPDKRSETHRALIQKLYRLAAGQGFERQISKDAGTGLFAPTSEFEESTLTHGVIGEFGDHLFWDELISRLSVRDAAHKVGGFDRLNAMGDRERQALEGQFRSRYIAEFTRNGINDLVVIDGFSGAAAEPVRTSD